MAARSTQNQSQKKQTVKDRLLGFKRNRAAVITFGVLVILAATGGTVIAANSSKPGDLLYSIDRAAEQVRLALSFTDSMKEAAYRSMATERLQEIKSLFKDKNINASGIAIALADFEQQKQAALNLASKANNSDAEKELASDQSEIDKLFEGQQAAIENQRESLKQQAETAAKSGNSALSSQLIAQANLLDSQLKTLELKREESKQQQEKFSESLHSETTQTTDSKAAEAQKETINKQKEALTEAVKQEVEAQAEAAKKAQEQQQEAAKKAQELQQEDAKKASEQESNH